MIPFDTADLSLFTQFAEVIADDTAEQFLLHGNGLLRNVRLEVGMWSEDNSIFTPESTVFACEALSPGDAVLIQAEFSSMRLSYNSADTKVSVLVTSSS